MNTHKVDTNDTPKRRFITAAIFITLGLLFGGTGVWIATTGNHMVSGGVEAKATILGKNRIRRRAQTSSTRFTRDYLVRYQFETPEGRYRDQKTVSGSFYHSIRSGDRVPVRYLASDPDMNEIEPGTFDANALIAGGFGLAFLVFAGVIVFLPRRSELDTPQRFGRTSGEDRT